LTVLTAARKALDAYAELGDAFDGQRAEVLLTTAGLYNDVDRTADAHAAALEATRSDQVPPHSAVSDFQIG
jgi:hypothetical protein